MSIIKPNSIKTNGSNHENYIVDFWRLIYENYTQNISGVKFTRHGVNKQFAFEADSIGFALYGTRSYEIVVFYGFMQWVLISSILY